MFDIVALTCNPSAMHWAPAPDISFCQRESPSNLKFNFSASPSSCALVSVRAFLPSSNVTKVRFLHSAAEPTCKADLHPLPLVLRPRHIFLYPPTGNKDKYSWLVRLHSPLFHSPLAIGSIPSSLRSQVLSTKCSSTRLLSRTLATLCAPDNPICVNVWTPTFTEYTAQS